MPGLGQWVPSQTITVSFKDCPLQIHLRPRDAQERQWYSQDSRTKNGKARIRIQRVLIYQFNSISSPKPPVNADLWGDSFIILKHKGSTLK